MEVIDAYLDAINKGAMPQVTNTWMLLCRTKNTGLIQRLVATFEAEARALPPLEAPKALREALGAAKGRALSQQHRAERFCDVADTLEADLDTYSTARSRPSE